VFIIGARNGRLLFLEINKSIFESTFALEITSARLVMMVMESKLSAAEG
jgi:hypothetical protein